MLYRTDREQTRLTMAAGLALAGGIAFAAGMAAPLPDRLVSPLFELVVIVDGQAHIADHGLTLADCVERWQEFPPVGFGLECNPVGSR